MGLNREIQADIRAFADRCHKDKQGQIGAMRSIMTKIGRAQVGMEIKERLKFAQEIEDLADMLKFEFGVKLE